MMNKPHPVAILIILLAILMLAVFLLIGCATTPTEYVPAECPKATPVQPPHDYMIGLKPNAPPPDFVRACLSTRAEIFRAYNECALKLKAYE